MNGFRRSILLSAMSLMGACTHMRITERNPKTGRFPTRKVASVVKSVKTDLDRYKSLLLLPDNDFVRGQINNINYFEETISVEQLEEAIVEKGLRDQMPSIRDQVGIRKAITAHKPFLWLQFKTRHVGALVFGQFVLIRPDDLEELFVVEKEFDYAVAGVNDQNTWYPMFNAMVDYIDLNTVSWSAS